MTRNFSNSINPSPFSLPQSFFNPRILRFGNTLINGDQNALAGLQLLSRIRPRIRSRSEIRLDSTRLEIVNDTQPARRWRRSIGGGRVRVTVYSGQIGCTQHSYSGGSNLITPRWAFTTLDRGKRHLSRARPLTTNYELHSERIHLATSGTAKVVLMPGQHTTLASPTPLLASCFAPILVALRPCFRPHLCPPFHARPTLRIASRPDFPQRATPYLTPSSTEPERNRLERVISSRFIFSMGQRGEFN